MKWSYLNVLLFLVLLEPVFAQTFRMGLTTGLDATEVNGASPGGHLRKPGVCLGLFVNNSGGVYKDDLFQLELNFIQKGSFYRGDSLGNGRFKIALSYVEVPILLRHRMHFNKGGKPVNRVDFELGASYGRLVGYYSIDSQNSILPPNNSYYNFNDISILTGIDINVSPKFVVCIRYSNSVIPALKRNTPNLHFITYTFNRGNNMVLLFAMKFMFGQAPTLRGEPAEIKKPEKIDEDEPQ